MILSGFHYHSRTEVSTQELAKALPPLEDDACMEVVYTFCQQQGRGQRGNIWFGGENENICATFVLAPRFLKAEHLFFLDMALSLGVLRYARSRSGDFFLKWPNDLYFRNKKAAGLLLESTVQSGHVERVFFGVGLNVNSREFPLELPRAVSLFQIDGHLRDLQAEVRELTQNIQACYAEFRQTYGQGILQEWKERYMAGLLFKDRWRDFVYRGSGINACIRNVDDDGRLVLERREGSLLRADIKELEYHFDE